MCALKTELDLLTSCMFSYTFDNNRYVSSQKQQNVAFVFFHMLLTSWAMTWKFPKPHIVQANTCEKVGPDKFDKMEIEFTIW